MGTVMKVNQKVTETKIIVGQVQVGSIRANANLLQGDNMAPSWRSHSKTNYALGRVNGDTNLVECRLNYLSDPDYIDMKITMGSPGEKQGRSVR